MNTNFLQQLNESREAYMDQCLEAWYDDMTSFNKIRMFDAGRKMADCRANQPDKVLKVGGANGLLPEVDPRTMPGGSEPFVGNAPLEFSQMMNYVNFDNCYSIQDSIQKFNERFYCANFLIQDYFNGRFVEFNSSNDLFSLNNQTVTPGIEFYRILKLSYAYNLEDVLYNLGGGILYPTVDYFYILSVLTQQTVPHQNWTQNGFKFPPETVTGETLPGL